MILHLGAKVRALPSGGVSIGDSKQMLKCLGKDRAMIEFKNAKDLQAHRAALSALLRQWIRYV